MLRLLTLLFGTATLTSFHPASPAAAEAVDPPVYYAVTPGARWVYAEDGREWAEVVTGVDRGVRMTFVSVGRVGADGTVAPHARLVVLDRGVFRLGEGGGPDAAVCLL